MSGVLLLLIITVITLGDFVLVALMMRKAKRDIGSAPVAGGPSPETARQFRRIILVSSAVLWIAVAAISFGLIPFDGIDPITFQSQE